VLCLALRCNYYIASFLFSSKIYYLKLSSSFNSYYKSHYNHQHHYQHRSQVNNWYHLQEKKSDHDYIDNFYTNNNDCDDNNEYDHIDDGSNVIDHNDDGRDTPYVDALINVASQLTHRYFYPGLNVNMNNVYRVFL